MRASRAVIALVPLLLLATTACDSADPVSIPAANRATVRILGPALITESGTYTWQAVFNGQADEDAFRWEIYRLDADVLAFTRTGRTLTLDVNLDDGAMALRLSVLVDGARLDALHIVNTCGPPLDDQLIGECSTF